MSSLPPQAVVLTTDNTTEVSEQPQVFPPPTTIILKKHLLHRHRYSRLPSQQSSLSESLDALQTGSLSYASTTHYRPAPESSSSLREILPIPESIARTQTFALLEPFLFPLLFPLGCCTAILQSIYMVLPIFPAALIVGLAGSIILPFICVGTISVVAMLALKTLLRMVEKRIRALARLGDGVVGAVERVAKLYRDAVVMLRCLARSGGRMNNSESDDGRTAEKRPTPSRRSSLKPGPSILKPSRPLQVYEELPPSPLPAPTLRPRAASFGGSSSGAVQVKAKEIFRSHLLAEKLQVDLTSNPQQLPTPPSSDHTPSPPFNTLLDIPPFITSYEPAEEASPTPTGSASPTSYFTNPRFSVSSIDLTCTSTASSSYAPTPKTPGSPLVQAMQPPKIVKHVRIVEPSEMDDSEAAVLYYDPYEMEARPMFREFAAAKLQDALGLLQTGAGQVWGS